MDKILTGSLVLLQMLEISLTISDWDFKIPKYPSKLKNSYADLLESVMNVNKVRMNLNSRLANLDSYVYGKDHLRTSNENDQDVFQKPNITFAVVVLNEKPTQKYEIRDIQDLQEINLQKIADDYYDDEAYLRIADDDSDDSEPVDTKYAESSGDEFHKIYSSEVNYKSSNSCRKGRRLCNTACREAAKDLCSAYGFFDCSYKTLCRRHCRTWF